MTENPEVDRSFSDAKLWRREANAPLEVDSPHPGLLVGQQLNLSKRSSAVGI